MKRLRRPFGVLLFLACAASIRLAYAYGTRIGLQGDQNAYVLMAQGFLDQGFFGPDAGRVPLYSGLLALCSRLTGASVWAESTFTALNLMFDLISVWLLLRIGRRLGGFAAAAPGVLLVSLSPLWFGNVNAAVTEPLSVALFLAFLELWSREKRGMKEVAWAGAFMGLLILSRAIFVLFPVAMILFERLFRQAPRGVRLDLRGAGAFLAGAYLFPVLWGFRNLVASGRFIMTQLASTPILSAWTAIKYPTFDMHVEEHARFWNTHPYSEVLRDVASQERKTEVYALMKAEVWDYLSMHPLEYAQGILAKWLRLWVTGWWNPFSYVYSPPYLSPMYIGSFVLPVLALGTLGLCLSWGTRNAAHWRATRVQALLFVYLTAVTAPLIVDARYTLIPYVALALWVGAGLAWIGKLGEGQK